MSPDNVETVLQQLQRLNETGVPAWEYFDPAIQFSTRPDGPGGRATFCGLDDTRQAWQQVFDEIWESIQVEIREVIPTGDTVVALVHVRLRGRGSGIDLDADEAWAYWLRGGVIVRVEQYGTNQEALKAAGLSQ